jgi:hypothetical protein
MLSTALQATAQLLQTISTLPAPPAEAAGVQAQVESAGEKLLPAISGMQDRLLALARQGTAQVAALSSAAAAGGDPATATAELHALGEEFELQAATLAGVVSQLGDFRDAVSGDVATMTSEQTRLSGQLAGLAASRDHWATQLASIQKQESVTRVIDSFIPVAWLGGEVASEIQYGKTTEAALAEASQQLAALAGQAQALQAAISACGLLSSALEQLSGTLQGLANAVSLVRADLADDAVRAAVATPVTLRLYLASLSAGLTVLTSGVS